MSQADLVLLTGPEVKALLAGREQEVIRAVECAYLAHEVGQTVLPHSVFLRFPGPERSRIIALPAYLGAAFGLAGLKWIASFPTNVPQGMDRASAVLILNSTATGRPECILEASLISGSRTAASAASAAAALHHAESFRLGLIGCGMIGFETLRYILSSAAGRCTGLTLHDLDPARAEYLRARCSRTFESAPVETAVDSRDLLARCSLTVLATTAVQPHISDLSVCPAGSTLLHVSLRDLSAEAILHADNVVDDPDHVCRSATSVHLAEQACGNRSFIRCTLGQILAGTAPPKTDPAAVTVFSPFGLGFLDLAVGQQVWRLAAEQGVGRSISSFFPPPWNAEAIRDRQ